MIDTMLKNHEDANNGLSGWNPRNLHWILRDKVRPDILELQDTGIHQPADI